MKEGEKLKYLIKEKGHTQETLAKAIGIERTYLTGLLKLDKFPKHLLKKALEVLGVSQDEFNKMSIQSPDKSDYKDKLIETLKEQVEDLKEHIKTLNKYINNIQEKDLVKPNIVQQPKKKQPT